jgi:hypothetical protein
VLAIRCICVRRRIAPLHHRRGYKTMTLACRFFYFDKRIRQSTKVFTDFSCLVRQLQINGAFRVPIPSTTARKFYSRMKKDESPETDLQTENMVPKAVCYRTVESGRIITRGAITTPYLAINWQREHINAPCALRDRRFPTPPTAWKSDTNRSGRNREGGGGEPNGVAENAILIMSLGNFGAKGTRP